ncbi:hypothetical protein HYH03_003765 [Edaphochlamys debaryana]|uniref:Uncharacterized protein n=1 Tax=Edaphochlamys debaryana TaxID=47281 RepID=A0A835YIY4_9CHLO|nr:hypothetical protein HYH03_003765 [Edaphochlamys debaryana]|eukprot:KAG2498514.1 hypothetical protein HYH03_003765 [Edaphochlamys debaryana]
MLAGIATVLGGVAAPLPSQAGILEGTVSWWKDRKKENSFKLIAPLKVAQQRLEAAAGKLKEEASPVEVLQLVRSSSLNCYVYEALPGDSFETRTSLFTQSNNFGSDPCTFRIIIKNAVAFAPPADKDRGADLLNSLILSYQKLDSELEAAADGGAEARDRAQQQLASTLQIAYAMEGFVREMFSAM